MRRTTLLTIISLTVLAFGCAKEEAAPAASAPPSGPASTEPVTLSEGFATPESVLYDAEQDVYFVSNINGSPLDKDGNGYIARIDAETREMESKWIDGETEGVTLSAPKGMTISGDTLWVTDIDTLRKFDRKTGEPLGEIAFEGATFLNDLTTGADGSVYMSDTGMQAGEGGFVPSGSAAVYRIAPDESVEKLIAGPELMAPNGLVVTDEGVWVVTFGGKELFLVADGQKSEVIEIANGSLDGVVLLENGDLLISSWDASTVYRGPRSGPFEAVVTDVNAPADIGYDTKRDLILIPLFNDHKVMLHPSK